MKRDNRIELCRIITMLFIVMHHCVVSGLNLNGALNLGQTLETNISLLLITLNSFLVVGVNVFFLISGYLRISFKPKKLAHIVFEVIIYSTIIYMIMTLLGINQFGIKGCLSNTIFSINNYWFVVVYCALCFLSPFINMVFDYLTEKNQIKKCLFTFVFITCIYCFLFRSQTQYLSVNNGYSLNMAILMYMLGMMIRKGWLKEFSSSKSFILYSLCSIINAGGGMILEIIRKPSLTWHLFSYNNPLVVLGSVFFFLGFIKIQNEKVDNKFALQFGKIGKYTFAVYIIHSNPLLKEYRFLPLVECIDGFSLAMWPLLILLYCFCLLIVCVFVDMLRVKFSNCTS